VFFPFVFFIYYLLPSIQWRRFFLLVASSYFYAAFIPIYLLVLYATIIIDYGAGICIEKYTEKKKLFLIISIIANIGILFFFKYFNFFTHSHLLTFILPIGLSFHTFQALSYTIEVYRSNQKAEKNFITYALYVMFFPQLVAGPIERPQNILPQLHAFHTFNYANVVSGLKLMVLGFYAKLMIADWLATAANASFEHVSTLHGPALLFGIICFSIQIFCDFFGYSLIAIGSAKTLGIHLMQNFNAPYISKSISEFWRRWHISLSSWFKDYVYIPLGGNRKHKIRNILIVFILSGLWHGAAWTYVIWGLLHGIYIAIESYWKKPFNLVTTYILVLLTWVFFRAPDLHTALIYIKRTFTGWNENIFFQINNLLSMSLLPKLELMIIFISIAIVYVLNLKGKNIYNFIETKHSYVRWSFYITLVVVMLIFGKLINEQGQFIYFQF
jgi:D-alanyl-lipoteichoic acid acyltransferase DltB (MBOAT superfamily)